MEMGENVGIAIDSPNQEEEVECSTCAESEFLGYKTKHGELKKERVLEKNLHDAGVVTNDSTVGPVYPLDGGNDPTKGWQARAGVFEDFPVSMAAAPHHLIPGKAAMAESQIEKWTCVSKEKIKEDIGYNIDCAQNGIFLPHLPEIYWTKRIEDLPMSKFYGQTWRGLSSSAKESIAFLLMNETWLQMHYTNHDDPYEEMSPYDSYDQECIDLCDELEEDIRRELENATCPECGKKVDKHAPPYEVVHQINQISKDIQNNIEGNPLRWTSWVSPLARLFTKRLQENKTMLSHRGLIRRIT